MRLSGGSDIASGDVFLRGSKSYTNRALILAAQTTGGMTLHNASPSRDSSVLIEALEKRDYPVVTAINLLMAGFVLVVNFLIDIAYAWLDPRIRYD